MPLPPHSAAIPLMRWLTAARITEESLSASMLRIWLLRSMKVILVMPRPRLMLGRVQLLLSLARRAVEPADHAREQAGVVIAGVRDERVGVAPGAGGGSELRHGLGHGRRARGVDEIGRQQIRQIVGRPAAAKHGGDALLL